MPTRKKPRLIKCGNHYINPADVSHIRSITREFPSGKSKTLYVVDFISNPNPEWSCWIPDDDIGVLLNEFEIITGD
jgi:hypothetical protein